MAVNAHTLPPSAILPNLPTEILEQIAFYYICPRIIGLPKSLTPLLLTCKVLHSKLTYARVHLYARVFRYKFSFSAIIRRGFDPRAKEWAWQLRHWCTVLREVQRRQRGPVNQVYADSVDDETDNGIPVIMYALWLMCLEDDGCNRLQMQLVGVYEWVEGWIRNEMHRVLDKGWPVENAANSCAMWVLWYLTTKARLMEETHKQSQSLVDLVLPFVILPFRYPSTFAPPNHFRLPLRFSDPSDAPAGPSTIPTPHGSYPVYRDPFQHTWHQPHYDRWTNLTTPLASDAAKLLYFSRREIAPWPMFPTRLRNREEHRARIRARLTVDAEDGVVTESEVERALRSELPHPTMEDIDEVNRGLLGGEIVGPSNPNSPSSGKGGGTALPLAYDRWDDVRKAVPLLLDSSSSSSFGISDADLDTVESILSSKDGEPGLIVDESLCPSRRWDPDWWRLRLCRSAWTQNPPCGDAEDEDNSEDMEMGVQTKPVEERDAEIREDEVEGGVLKEMDDDMDNERSLTMLTGYPQKGTFHTPGSLNGLWAGRMIIPSEAHLRALFLPPNPPPPAPAPALAAANPGLNNANVNANPIPPDAPALPVQAVEAAPAAPHFGAPPPVVEQAGHRPTTFTEDSLVTVPIYVRLQEHAVYSDGSEESGEIVAPVPCANDTQSRVELDVEVGPGGRSASVAGGDGSRRSRLGRTDDDSTFDQGVRDAWFPPNTVVHTRGDSLVVTVPSGSGATSRRGGTEKYEYTAINNSEGGSARESGSDMNDNIQLRRKPGMFHDPDTCSGCRAREKALRDASMGFNPSASVRDTPISPDAEEELLSCVPSPKTLPPCNGIRDIIITGSTDPQHAEAWGKGVWKGRVRKWDGLIGMVRSPNGDARPTDASSSEGRTFFYGTLLGGQNLVGTWRHAYDDPRMPVYEGPFTLGKKNE